jgi:hypothetical protein
LLLKRFHVYAAPQNKRPVQPPETGQQLTSCPEGYTISSDDRRLCVAEASFPNPVCPNGVDRNAAGECQSTETIPAVCNEPATLRQDIGKCEVTGVTKLGTCPDGFSPNPDTLECFREEFQTISGEPASTSLCVARFGEGYVVVTNPKGNCMKTITSDDATCDPDTLVYNTVKNVCEGSVFEEPFCRAVGVELVEGTGTCRSTETAD